MKKMLFSVAVALAASAFVSAASFAGTFGLIPRSHFGHGCRCGECVKPYNAFSRVTVVSLDAVSPAVSGQVYGGEVVDGEVIDGEIIDGGVVEGGCADGSCGKHHFGGKLHRHHVLRKLDN